MLHHTQTLNQVCGCTIMKLLLRFVLTAKNVNNTSLVHLSEYLGVFLDWETEKGGNVGKHKFLYIGVGEKYKYKHEFFFLLKHAGPRNSLVVGYKFGKLVTWNIQE